jgi:hypothetical protein
MALIRINQNPSRRELRQFAGIWFPLFCLVAAGLVYASTSSTAAAGSLAAGGLLVGVTGLKRPAFMLPIYLGWMYAAFPIGWMISHLVLGTVFYLLVTPIGLAMRVTGYNPMARRFPSPESTHWVTCDRPSSKRYYLRQY